MSDKSDAMLRVRAALVLRGSSLMAWSNNFAERTERDQAATYSTVKMTLRRWGDRTDRAPEGELAREILDALRADLGPDVVRPFGPEAPKVFPKRKRSQAGHARAA